MSQRKLQPREMMYALEREGIVSNRVEAIHMLVDMGEITSDEHAELLSRYAPEEYERVYG